MGGGGGLCIHPQVIVTVEGSMGIVTMELQGKQIPFSSSVGLLTVKEAQNAKLGGRGGECGNLGYLLHETAQALCRPPPACPPSGGRECRLLTETWLQLPGAHLVHVVSTPPKVQMAWKYLKKFSPLYKRKKKDGTLGNFDFSS